MYVSDDPQLLEQWDFEKNEINPYITPWNSSSIKVWWKCTDEDHSFERIIRDHWRSAKRNCAICGGKQFLKGFNDLTTMYPELAKQFDTERNNIDPSDIKASGDKPYWWRCEKFSHPHLLKIGLKIRGKGCGVCNGRQVLVGFNDFATINPDIAKELNVELSGKTAQEFTYGSDKEKLFWNCSLGHLYIAKPSDRNKGHGCNVCAGRVVLAGFNDLESNYPEIAAEFDVKKNDTTPDKILKSSIYKHWWICPIGHSYDLKVDERTRKNSGCPYCSNHRVLTGFNDLQTIYPKIAEELDEVKSGFKASAILAGTTKMAYWKCKVCQYEWSTKVANRTIKGKGSGCYACVGKTVIKGKNDLLSQKPEIADTLNEERSGFKADEVSYGSRKVGYFNCSNCKREIKAQIRKRSGLFNPHLCSNCSGRKSKSEEKLASYIREHCSKSIDIEYNNRQIIKPYELDIYIPYLKMAVEFNGAYWHSDEVVRKNKGMSADEYHNMKFQMCKNLGIELFFVEEADWKEDEQKVCENIRKEIAFKHWSIF